MRASIIKRIEKHYHHARVKHPYFCDCIQREWIGKKHRRKPIEHLLDQARKQLYDNIWSGSVSAFDVLTCELYEMAAAAKAGDMEAAVREAFDSIAVLIRMVDVFEHRQKLGWCQRWRDLSEKMALEKLTTKKGGVA